MEYSLQYLNKLSNLNNLKLKEIVEILNLIGFEVDNIIETNCEINKEIKNISLLLKIPANREDLLIEEVLLNELTRLFSVERIKKWEKAKFLYNTILKNHYIKYLNYSTSEIKSTVKNVLSYILKIDNIKQFHSPLWLQKKLINIGITPTQTLNDLINLINFEWGLRLTISLNKTSSGEFFLEQISNDINIINENGEEIKIPKHSIILKDNLDETKSCIGYIFPILSLNLEKNSILIEATFYDIHANLLNLKTLNSKLSTRYLRKTFLEFYRFSLQRFLTLLEILTDSSNLVIHKYKTNNFDISLKSNKILKVKIISFLNFLKIKKYDDQIFSRTGLEIIGKTKIYLYIEIPNIRKDLEREIDIIEEYSRFIGYKNFNEILPLKNKTNILKKINKYKFLREFFINLGFNEVINSSIQENKKQNNNSIILKNPLNNDFFLLRSELSIKLIETFESNVRAGYLYNNFFEIGRIFKNINNNLVEEDRLCAIFQPLYGKNEILFSVDWYINKGIFENLFKIFGYNNLSFESVKNKNSIYHPTRSCIIKQNNKILGIFGEINPFFKTTKEKVYLIELNLSEFKDSQLYSKIHFSKELSKYPSIKKDLSLTIEKNIDLSKLKECIESKNLKTFSFFDIYFPELVSTKINIGIRLEFQSDLQTLLTDDIDKQIEEIKKILQIKFNAIFN